MGKIAIVYWSGTGNTEAMANAVSDGATKAGAQAELINAADFNAMSASGYSAFAFGCPAMGSEVLEETEFQPMWDAVKGKLGSKPVGLFGSYGWGGGEWMESWKDDAAGNGVNVVSTVIANEAPDDAAIAECEALGKTLAG